MKNKIQINQFRTWNIGEHGFFITDEDTQSTIEIMTSELEDFKELIRKTELEMGLIKNKIICSVCRKELSPEEYKRYKDQQKGLIFNWGTCQGKEAHPVVTNKDREYEIKGVKE